MGSRFEEDKERNQHKVLSPTRGRKRERKIDLLPELINVFD